MKFNGIVNRIDKIMNLVRTLTVINQSKVNKLYAPINK